MIIIMNTKKDIAYFCCCVMDSKKLNSADRSYIARPKLVDLSCKTATYILAIFTCRDTKTFKKLIIFVKYLLDYLYLLMHLFLSKFLILFGYRDLSD